MPDDVIRFRGGKVTAHTDVHVIPLMNFFQRSGRRVATKIGKEIETEAKVLVPVRTGELRRSIHANRPRQVGRWRVEARVTASAPYARYVHEGTRPHIIRARNAKALHFYWPYLGRDVFFKSVHHPGTGKTPFLKAAANTVAKRHR